MSDKINPNFDAGAIQGKQITPEESVKEAKELSPLAKDTLKTSDEVKTTKALPAVEDPKIEAPEMSLIPKVISKEFTEDIHDSLKDLIAFFAELRAIISDNHDLVIRFEKKVVTAIIEGRYNPEMLNEFLVDMDEDQREGFKEQVRNFVNYYKFEDPTTTKNSQENTMANLIILLLSLQSTMSKNKLSDSLGRIRDHINKIKNADTSSGLKKLIRELEAKESDIQAMVGIGKVAINGVNMGMGMFNQAAVAREIKNKKQGFRDEIRGELGLPSKGKDGKYPNPGDFANADKYTKPGAKEYATDYNKYVDEKKDFDAKKGKWDPTTIGTGPAPADPVKPRLSKHDGGTAPTEKLKSLRKELAAWKTSDRELSTQNNVEQTNRRLGETLVQGPEIIGGIGRSSAIRERAPHEADKEKLDHMMDLHNKETDSKTEHLNHLEGFIDNLNKILERLDQILLSSNPNKA